MHREESIRVTVETDGAVEVQVGGETIVRLVPIESKTCPWQVWLSHIVTAPNTNGHPDLRPLDHQQSHWSRHEV